MLILIFLQPSNQDSSRPSADTEPGHTPTQRESTSDIDYFEKFTLLDAVAPGERAPELHEEVKQPAANLQTEKQKPAKEVATGSPSASEDSFVFVSDVDIVEEHLDEVFYGEGPPANALRQKEEDRMEGGGGMRSRRESQRSMKGSGSVLFESEETSLTPIFISPGPPKIIDPILLEEPTAMSFMYSDLYEDAVGERRTSDEEYSDAESVASEKSYVRCLSDSEEADGYLEKFTLKDETPTLDAHPVSVASEGEGRMMWPQNKFEMTGCLIKVAEEEQKEKAKKEETEKQDVSVGDRSEDLHSALLEEKREIDRETETEELKLSEETQEQAMRATSEDSLEKQMGARGVTHEEETDEVESETQLVDCKVDQTQQDEGHQREEQSCGETGGACEEHKVSGKTVEVLVVRADEAAAPVSSEVPPEVTKSQEQAETRSLSDIKIVAADEELVTTAERLAEVKEPETVRQEMLTLTEPSRQREDTSAETSALEPNEAAAVAPIEVVTDCDAAVHTVVEIMENVMNEKEIQTQVHVDLQEVRSVQTADAPEERESLIEGSTAEDALNKKAVAALQELELTTEPSSEVAKPGSQAAMTDSDEKHHETDEQQQDMTDGESHQTNSKIPAETTRTLVQDIVTEGDDLILLVPKGQAVEMDIEISQWSEKDSVSSPKPDCTGELQTPVEETKMEPRVEVEPETSAEEKEQTRNDFHMNYAASAPVEEADSEEQGMQRDLEKDKVIFSSGLHREDAQLEQTDAEQKAEIVEMEETSIIKEDLSPCVDLHREDVEQKMERDGGFEEPVPDIEMEYEVISEQDAKETPEPETQRDAAGLFLPERSLKEEEDEEMEVEKADYFPEEELIEADYEIIDAEEEKQAQLAAELQGMDWFCLTCGCLLSERDCVSGEHHSHDVTAVDTAYEEIKVI